MGTINLKKQHQSVDKKLLVLIIAFTVLGLIAVADASAPQALNSFNDKYYFIKEQLKWALGGFVLLALFTNIKYTFWEKLATPIFIGGIILLLVVLIPGLSLKALGARRWLSIGFIRFQPSEVIKLALSIYLAKVASKDKRTLAYFIPIAVVAGLIMFEPDLGTTMVVMAIGLSQIFVAGVPLLHFIGAIFTGGVSALALIFTSSYRRDRFMTFINQSQDPLGRDYHLRQILLALGSGGLFGVGLGQGRQKFLFLPEAATDSIFAIIAEEFGLLGSLLILGLFAYFFYLGIKIAKSAPDKFSQVLALGLTVWIAGQAFLNIGAMCSLIPLTGIPLPFFSYGGSSLIMVMAASGILLNISKFAHAKK